ncbi:hypothetical protein B0J15DRAFT_468339 [Fusarium solani]|uniref:Uncharacterized protein n=1 Tax=Fusarium solani TaxID=169388 RepID=A0A9P9GZB9_FUSSL|nr:uncharacterized protein B0J15DRAFT_468339 [Fusarium solani]KAH7248329.1 hypothetical protein B0J15DRAFT_468339 [Fusarium solani]
MWLLFTFTYLSLSYALCSPLSSATDASLPPANQQLTYKTTVTTSVPALTSVIYTQTVVTKDVTTSLPVDDTTSLLTDDTTSTTLTKETPSSEVTETTTTRSETTSTSPSSQATKTHPERFVRHCWKPNNITYDEIDDNVIKDLSKEWCREWGGVSMSPDSMVLIGSKIRSGVKVQFTIAWEEGCVIDSDDQIQSITTPTKNKAITCDTTMFSNYKKCPDNYGIGVTSSHSWSDNHTASSQRMPDMAGCTRRQPTCLIDVPAGCETGFYYVSINNIPNADIKAFRGHWLKNIIIESQQFHHDARTGWICLKSRKQFINAIEPAILRRLRAIPPAPSQNPRRTHKVEPNLTPQAAASSVNVIIAGVSDPEIQEFRGWVLESLGSDCLMATTSRLVNIGGSQQRLTRCTLNSRCGFPADKVLRLLKQHCVGLEDAIISVEPEEIGTRPVVVIGSSKLPQAWPTIVTRWWRVSRNGLDGSKGPSRIE